MGSSENTHYKNDSTPLVHRCGDLAFDFASRSVIRPDKRTNLPEAYFNALVVLLESNGKLVPKAELAKVAGTSEDTLYKVIEILRKALGDTDEPRRLILTERGLGYRFVGGPLSNAGEPAANAKPSSTRRNTLLAVASVLCLVGVLATALYWNAKPVASVRLDGPFLVAYDASGKTLWRCFLEQGVESYRYTPATMADLSWIGDLDGDGKQEVLFAYSPDTESAIAAKMSPSSRLLCFSQRGRLKWSFQVGRKVRDMTGDIHPPFAAEVIRVALSPGSHPSSRIIVASGHPTDQAFQLAFLDSAGHLRADYWHPGSVDHLLILRDLKGSPRLIAAGVNNGEHQATLVELDPFAMKGASTPFSMKDQTFKLLDMPEAHEDLVVLFPRTCLSEGAPYTRIGSIDPHDGGFLASEFEDYKGSSNRLIYYDFDSSLRLTRAFLSSQFREEHMKLEQAGLVNHSWRQDQDLLSTGLIYRPKAP
jgi:DNA-binding winged helix-turn-helix (wHTH) protein